MGSLPWRRSRSFSRTVESLIGLPSKTPAADLLFHLRGRAPLGRQRNVGECGIGRCPVPMFLLRWNVHDISHADDLLLRFRGDDALARSNKQHLIAAMDVHFVPGAGAEIDDGKIKVVAHLRRQQCLSGHGPAREQGIIRWFRGNRVGFYYLHLEYPPSSVYFFMFHSFQLFQPFQTSGTIGTSGTLGTHVFLNHLASSYPVVKKISSLDGKAKR
jgi:hypothetical protein